jgi:hypothetical protein
MAFHWVNWFLQIGIKRNGKQYENLGKKIYFLYPLYKSAPPRVLIYSSFTFSFFIIIFPNMPFRLDPFPKFSQDVLRSVQNARIIIFAVVIAKITLDRLYKYAMVSV